MRKAGTTLYKIPASSLVLDGSEKAYVLAVRDMPSHERPREKLCAYGPEVLSTAELLSVVFGQGSSKEGVLALTQRIVREYGEKSLFSHKDVSTIMKDLGVPRVKALQIVAVGELGRRFFERTRNGAVVTRTARDVFEYVADMRELPKEHVRGLYLDTHYQVIHDEILSVGTVNANIVHPREVFRPALACSAVAVILVHNHPSGVLLPSEEDLQVTRGVCDAGSLLGIELIDHVIVSREGFMSVPFLPE